MVAALEGLDRSLERRSYACSGSLSARRSLAASPADAAPTSDPDARSPGPAPGPGPLPAPRWAPPPRRPPQVQQPGQLPRVAHVGLDPVPRRALQLRRRRQQTPDAVLGQEPRQTEPSRAGLVGHRDRARQRLQPAPQLAVIRRQPPLEHLPGLPVQTARDHRPGVHIQPDTRPLLTDHEDLLPRSCKPGLLGPPPPSRPRRARLPTTPGRSSVLAALPSTTRGSTWSARSAARTNDIDQRRATATIAATATTPVGRLDLPRE